MIGIEDGDRFFEIVQTTPDLIEADLLLRGALSTLAEQMTEAVERRDNTQMHHLGAVKKRVKAELHRIQTIQNETTWQAAVKAVCGPELYADCLTWIISKRAELMP